MEIHRINELVAVKQALPGTLGMLITRYRENVRLSQRTWPPRTRAVLPVTVSYYREGRSRTRLSTGSHHR